MEAGDQPPAAKTETDKESSDSAASGNEPDVPDETGLETPSRQDDGTASDSSGELVAMGEQDPPGAAEAGDRRPLLLRIWHSLSPLAFEDLLHAASFLLLGFLVCLAFERTPLPLLALFLGLATVLDLVATYFFMGPAIRLLASRSGLYEHPSRFGIPAPAEAVAPA